MAITTASLASNENGVIPRLFSYSPDAARVKTSAPGGLDCTFTVWEHPNIVSRLIKNDANHRDIRMSALLALRDMLVPPPSTVPTIPKPEAAKIIGEALF